MSRARLPGNCANIVFAALLLGLCLQSFIAFGDVVIITEQRSSLLIDGSRR